MLLLAHTRFSIKIYGIITFEFLHHFLHENSPNFTKEKIHKNNSMAANMKKNPGFQEKKTIQNTIKTIGH